MTENSDTQAASQIRMADVEAFPSQPLDQSQHPIHRFHQRGSVQ